MTQAPTLDDTQRQAVHRRALQRRRLQTLFRRMLVDRETAAMLDLRAEQSADPDVVAHLRERAAARRQRAAHARTVLVAEGVLGVRLPV
jgi:hypothetical protein